MMELVCRNRCWYLCSLQCVNYTRTSACTSSRREGSLIWKYIGVSTYKSIRRLCYIYDDLQYFILSHRAGCIFLRDQLFFLPSLASFTAIQRRFHFAILRFPFFFCQTNIICCISANIFTDRSTFWLWNLFPSCLSWFVTLLHRFQHVRARRDGHMDGLKRQKYSYFEKK